MSRYYPGAFVAFQPDSIFFVTITVIDWVDVFTREEYKNILVQSLDHCRRKKGLHIHAWVVMTNHIHLIVSHRHGKEKIATTIGDFKKYTAKQIINAIMENAQESRKKWMLSHFEEDSIKANDDASCSVSKTNGRTESCQPTATKPDGSVHYHLWQRGYHSFCISNIKMIRQKIDYLHANPIRAGIVDKPWDYRYSSCRSYAGERGLLEIDHIDLGIDDPTKPPIW